MTQHGQTVSEAELVRLATQARKQAYAPYSSFTVGAALLTGDGHVFQGCNVENISYGLTMCAERVAVGAAVQAGARHIAMIAIVSDSEEPVMPCGACRQVLAEFNPDLKVMSETLQGTNVSDLLSSLLPKPRQGILR